MNNPIPQKIVLTLLTYILLTACSMGVAQREVFVPPVPVTQTESETPPVPSPFPLLLHRVSLAPTGERLHDLWLDETTGRLYVTDTTDQLHVLDDQTYAELAVLKAGGRLVPDTDHERLYVSPRWSFGHTITIVDTASLAVAGVISGNSVAIDTTRNRIYVGHDGVSVYDGETLEKLGTIALPNAFSQAGTPVYNPLRDEVYIVDDTVYQADAETWQITGDLLPEVTAQTCHRCTGNIAARRAYIYPERNLLVVDMFTRASSGGPGYVIGPRFFDATTLAPITDPTQTPATLKGCEEQLILNQPVDGRTYQEEKSIRYTVYNNLMVYGPDGALETWRDGLPGGLTNPRTAQMYTPYNEGLLVLALPELTPVGTLPARCVHSLDIESGIFYVFDDGDLVVFAEQGGAPASPPNGVLEALPGTAVGLIAPSPNYAHDHTLFVGFYGESSYDSAMLYRSTDGGQTWTRLRGRLPESEYLSLSLTLSPGFAEDQTLFASGYIYTHAGIGVYRSTDAGDTWEPLWNGLSHLRVHDVFLSSNYATDGTLLAYAEYDRVTPSEQEWSIHRSTDRGATWSLLTTVPDKTSLIHPGDILPSDPAAPAIRFREANQPPYGIERSIDGGQTWHAIPLNRLSSTIVVEMVLPSPNLATDHTVYILTNEGLFRSTDDGDTWQRPVDTRLAREDRTQRLTAIALTPPLEDGRQQLFVGTADGELFALDPSTLTWASIEIAQQWPTILEGKDVNAIEVASDGTVWMSVQDHGLAHYANGTIQARYTITDGLPSPHINAITTAPDGAIWVGAELPASVAHLDPPAGSGHSGQSWTSYLLTEEQADLTVWDVAIAPDDTVWVGSDEPGLLHWDGQRWEHITDPEDRIGYLTRDIEIAPDGTVWCATPAGLALYKDGAWSMGWDGEVLAVEFSPDGSAYIVAGETRDVWRYANGHWLPLPSPGDSGVRLTLHVAADGAVWIGTAEGAFRYDGQAWCSFTARDGLSHDKVHAIAEDATGWLWFGTANGAVHVDPATMGLSPVAWP
jgi:photosystem II stability/assembly factor-like uncharacterized protein